MENDDPTASLLAGTGSDTDFVTANGGAANPYLLNQSAADILDNGAVTAAPNAQGGTTATYTPPSWSSALGSILQTGATDFSVVAPLINGKPAPPANPSSTPGASGTVSTGSFSLSSILPWLILGVLGWFGWKALKRAR